MYKISMCIDVNVREVMNFVSEFHIDADKLRF
jgi:hypothetical protein